MKEVKWFGEQMIKKLEDNEEKEHWRKSSYDHLFCRLEEEVRELQELILNDKISYKHKKMIAECADIANFAMMIADKARLGKIY